MGQAASEVGRVLGPTWLAERLHELKHEGPQPVLSELRDVQAHSPALSVLGEKLASLEKREAHMQYPSYQEAGWPIGSGSVESANKLVVEARLKGAGRHWERAHVNPMLLLGNAVCNQRWSETWQASVQERHRTRNRRRQEHTEGRLSLAGFRVLVSVLHLRWLSASSSPKRPPRYSWHQPFLRRPPASQNASAKI